MGREDEAFESEIADKIEDALRNDFNIEPGPRIRRNAQDASGLRVDFTYEDPIPQLALEVTSLRRDADLTGSALGRRIEERLRSVARREGLGGWRIAVSTMGKLKQLESELLALMRTDVSIRPGSYTSDDLFAAEAAGTLYDFYERHRRLGALGLVETERGPDGDDSVRLLALSQAGHIGEFDDPLMTAVRDNAAKLGEARPRETHLAVYVARWDASAEPSLTSTPTLPAEVDRLWVLLQWHGGGLWSVGRGETDWTVHKPAVQRS